MKQLAARERLNKNQFLFYPYLPSYPGWHLTRVRTVRLPWAGRETGKFLGWQLSTSYLDALLPHFVNTMASIKR